MVREVQVGNISFSRSNPVWLPAIHIGRCFFAINSENKKARHLNWNNFLRGITQIQMFKY